MKETAGSKLASYHYMSVRIWTFSAEARPMKKPTAHKSMTKANIARSTVAATLPQFSGDMNPQHPKAEVLQAAWRIRGFE